MHTLFITACAFTSKQYVPSILQGREQKGFKCYSRKDADQAFLHLTF